MRQQIGHDRVERGRCEAVADSGHAEQAKKENGIMNETRQCKSRSQQAEPGDEHGFSTDRVGETAGNAARKSRDDHHHGKETASRHLGKRKGSTDFRQRDAERRHHHRWHQVRTGNDEDGESIPLPRHR